MTRLPNAQASLFLEQYLSFLDNPHGYSLTVDNLNQASPPLSLSDSPFLWASNSMAARDNGDILLQIIFLNGYIKLYKTAKDRMFEMLLTDIPGGLFDPRRHSSTIRGGGAPLLPPMDAALTSEEIAGDIAEIGWGDFSVGSISSFVFPADGGITGNARRSSTPMANFVIAGRKPRSKRRALPFKLLSEIMASPPPPPVLPPQPPAAASSKLLQPTEPSPLPRSPSPPSPPSSPEWQPSLSHRRLQVGSPSSSAQLKTLSRQAAPRHKRRHSILVPHPFIL